MGMSTGKAGPMQGHIGQPNLYSPVTQQPLQSTAQGATASSQGPSGPTGPIGYQGVAQPKPVTQPGPMQGVVGQMNAQPMPQPSPSPFSGLTPQQQAANQQAAPYNMPEPVSAAQADPRMAGPQVRYAPSYVPRVPAPLPIGPAMEGFAQPLPTPHQGGGGYTLQPRFGGGFIDPIRRF